MSLAILFHLLCAQHVSDINISIIRSLRLFCWITTLVVLFLVWRVLGVLVWLGWSGICVAGWSTSCWNFELPHWSYCSWFDVCWEFRCGWVGVVSVLRAEAQVVEMLNYHIRRIVLGSMYVRVSVWLGWSGICVAGWSFSLQHGYHSNPTTPKLQHTSNQEKYDQCGNSTE